MTAQYNAEIDDMIAVIEGFRTNVRGTLDDAKRVAEENVRIAAVLDDRAAQIDQRTGEAAGIASATAQRAETISSQFLTLSTEAEESCNELNRTVQAIMSGITETSAQMQKQSEMT